MLNSAIGFDVRFSFRMRAADFGSQPKNNPNVLPRSIDSAGRIPLCYLKSTGSIKRQPAMRVSFKSGENLDAAFFQHRGQFN